MSTLSAAEIAVDLTARSDRLDRELATAGSRVDRRLGAMEARGSAFASKFTGFLAGVSAGAILVELGKLADTAKQLDAQLRLATNGFGSFAKAQDDTRKIAASTRSSLEATTSLYGNFARASQQTGRSQADAARATETFSKALKIGGADANAAASATLQFGQALASGALRGDEFNSIAEASPRLVRLIADSMGVTQGAVRALAAEGKLTGDVLFRALNDRKFTETIDTEFKTLPETFGEAMQQIKNAAVITFGAFDQGGQFSNAIVNMLSEGTNTFGGLEKLATDYGIEVRSVFSALDTVFDPLVSGATAAFGNITTQAHYARDTIASILSGIDQIRNIPIQLQNNADAFDNRVKGGFNEAMRRAGNKGPGFAIKPLQPLANDSEKFLKEQARQANQLRINARAAQIEGNGFVVVRNKDGSINADATTANGGTRKPASPPPPKPTPATGKKTKAKAAPRSPLNEDAFTRQEAQLNDRILRAKGDQAETAEQRADAEIARIEGQRVKNDELIKGDKRITDVQKARLTALTDLAAATEKTAVIRERDVAIEERTSASIRRASQSAEAGNRNEQDSLRSRLDLARTADERKEIELRLLALAQQQERVDQEQLIADRRRVLADKNATPDARAAATADIGDAERRLGTLGETQPNERAAVERRYASKGQQFVEGLNPERLKEDLEGVQIDGLNSLNDGLADAITGAKSLGDAFHDVAGSIVRDLVRIAIQQAIIKPLAGALFGGSATGGGGGIGGLFGSVLGSIGPVFGGGSKGNPSGVLSALPRLAGGGEIRAGGMGGVDKNVLSVNGVPRAMIGAHERLGVVNPNLGSMANVGAMANLGAARAAAPSQQVTNHYSISVDAKNSVNPAGFARELSSVILAEAARMDGRTYKKSLQDAPGHMASYNNLKS